MSVKLDGNMLARILLAGEPDRTILSFADRFQDAIPRHDGRCLAHQAAHVQRFPDRVRILTQSRTQFALFNRNILECHTFPDRLSVGYALAYRINLPFRTQSIQDNFVFEVQVQGQVRVLSLNPIDKAPSFFQGGEIVRRWSPCPGIQRFALVTGSREGRVKEFLAAYVCFAQGNQL